MTRGFSEIFREFFGTTLAPKTHQGGFMKTLLVLVTVALASQTALGQEMKHSYWFDRYEAIEELTHLSSVLRRFQRATEYYGGNQHPLTRETQRNQNTAMNLRSQLERGVSDDQCLRIFLQLKQNYSHLDYVYDRSYDINRIPEIQYGKNALGEGMRQLEWIFRSNGLSENGI